MDVLMPQLGETVAEGKITQWFKAAGDKVAPGDNLFEIETDKVSMEVPSTTSGVLAEIRIAAGEVAPVGAVVAVIADGGVSPGAAPAPSASSASAQSPLMQRMAGAAAFASTKPQEREQPKLDPFFEVRTPERNYGPARLAGGTVTTPLARRLAAERGIDLASVQGSGPHGRVLARDVEQARPSAAPIPVQAAPPNADAVRLLYKHTPFEEVPLDRMRGAIARRLLESKTTIPHFYLTMDVEIGRLIEIRETVNADGATDASGEPPLKISMNDFFVKAWASALARIKDANAVWAGDRILRFGQCDIAIAVALDDGLITPVIRQAERKTLSAISREAKELIARARSQKLGPDEYQGGTSTISNLGMHGVREFSAILNPPQATILAIGAARRQAVENADGAVRFASMLSVTLSCDHRVVDGKLGADLLAAFKAFVEQPVSMLI
jgi:pyruvate dehydrogenase E2 component (dihydrolipoyllysine-residue acetyltransferase)